MKTLVTGAACFIGSHFVVAGFVLMDTMWSR